MLWKFHSCTRLYVACSGVQFIEAELLTQLSASEHYKVVPVLLHGLFVGLKKKNQWTHKWINLRVICLVSSQTATLAPMAWSAVKRAAAKVACVTGRPALVSPSGSSPNWPASSRRSLKVERKVRERFKTPINRRSIDPTLPSGSALADQCIQSSIHSFSRSLSQWKCSINL